MKAFTTLLALSFLTACGSGSDSDPAPTAQEVSAHDNMYVISIYNTVGNCMTDGNQGVLKLKNGVLVDSHFRRSTISGMLTSSNKLEGFMDFNGDTVTFEGKFGSTLEGTWSADKADCSGYFEEYSREALTES